VSQQHILNRYDFKTVIAGVLKMIAEPAMFEKFHSYIDEEWIYMNDSSEQVLAVRKIIELMKFSLKEGGFKNMNIAVFDSLIDSKFIEEKTRLMVGAHYRAWIADDVIKIKMHDDMCFELFLEYLKIIQIGKRAKNFNQAYQSGNTSKSAEIMNEMLYSIGQISIKTNIQVFDATTVFDRLQNPPTNVDTQTFYTGCEPLDHNIGGIEPETLTTFISVTNGGKTAMCHHLIRQCVERKQYAYVACVEDREKSFIYKTLGSITGIDIWRLKKQFHELLPNELEAVKRALAGLNEYVRVEYIYGECHIKKRPAPFINIVDYTGHIVSKSEGDKTYEKTRNAYAARKDFALKYKKACIDFAQVNREGNKRLNESKQYLTHADLAGSYDLSQVCDNIISINRDATDLIEHRAKLHVSKCRDGESGKTYTVATDFRKYRFLMDKVTFHTTEEGVRRYQEETNDRSKVV
jgi:replicative DNA helicase